MLPWPQIAAEFGIAQSTAKAIYAEYLSWDVEVADPLAAVDEAIALVTALLRAMTAEVEFGDNSAARIGAAKAAVDLLLRRVELEQAAGRMPRNMARHRAEADFAQIAREFFEVLERRNVGREALDELHAVIQRHIPNLGDDPPPPVGHDLSAVNGVTSRPAVPQRSVVLSDREGVR